MHYRLPSMDTPAVTLPSLVGTAPTVDPNAPAVTGDALGTIISPSVSASSEDTEAVVAAATSDATSAVLTACAAADAAAAAVTAAVTVEATALLFLQVLQTAAAAPEIVAEVLQQQQAQSEQRCSALWDLLKNPVVVAPDHNAPQTLEDALAQFDTLLVECSRMAGEHEAQHVSDGFITTAPGFFTRNSNAEWMSPPHLPEYQSLPLSTESGLPVMSPASSHPVFLAMRQAIVERLRFLQEVQEDKDAAATYCSCISHWDVSQSLGFIVNQALEQVMAQEASDCLKESWPSPDQWDALYSQNNSSSTTNKCRNSIPTPVKVLRDRDTYLSVLVKGAMAAQTSIKIMTCYVFWDDPAQQYVLLDLLPNLVRTKGIKVQVLIDLLTVESATVKSAMQFQAPSAADKAKNSTAFPKRQMADGVTNTSFLNQLPADAPAITSGRSFSTASHFWQALFETASTCPNESGEYQVRFWCARDAVQHYRVKNHAKCVVFDDSLCIMGGSNLAPTVKSATSELDMVLAGDSVRSVGETFDSFWMAMGASIESTTSTSITYTDEKKEDEESPLSELIRSIEWDENECNISYLRSSPSSAGEDNIYRVVLDKIRAAKESVLVCMGHSSYCRSFADAVAEATERGVSVKILVNSLYSNDLRTGQRDLFVSLQELLRIAPKAEVYSTANRTDEDTGDIIRPEFIHAKYVLVDGSWCALGSWNLWTRSAFYEIEHEAFIDSTKIAKILEEKFQGDRFKHTIVLSCADCHDCDKFCPKGCILCQGFGPFFT